MDFITEYQELCRNGHYILPLLPEEYERISRVMGCHVLIHLNDQKDQVLVYQAMARDRYFELSIDQVHRIRNYMKEEAEAQCCLQGWDYRISQQFFDDDNYTFVECIGIKQGEST